MIINAPCCITSRLLPGICIGDVEISIGYADRPGDDGRTRYRWYLDGLEQEHSGDDLQSGYGNHGLQFGLENLLGFLGAGGEACLSDNGDDGNNSDLFLPEIAEWAANNINKLSITEDGVGELRNCIDEGMK